MSLKSNDNLLPITESSVSLVQSGPVYDVILYQNGPVYIVPLVQHRPNPSEISLFSKLSRWIFQRGKEADPSVQEGHGLPPLKADVIENL